MRRGAPFISHSLNFQPTDWDDALFMLRDGDDHRLHGRDAGREFEPALVAVRHDERADETGGNAPARLIRILEFAVTVEIFDLERGREVFAEIMRGAGLQRFAVQHHRFHRVGVHRPRELLLLRLFAREDLDGEDVLHELAVDFEHFESLLSRLFFGGVEGVPFLPEELARPEEGTGGLLPPDDVRPLVDEQGQIAVALHPLGVHVADDGLGSRAHDELLFKLRIADMRDKRDLGREAFHVLRLLHEVAQGDEHREIGILVPCRFETAVEFLLDVLPDLVAVRADDHRALDGAVVHQLRLQDDVGVPLRKIFGHVRDLFYEFVVLLHIALRGLRSRRRPRPLRLRLRRNRSRQMR